MRRRVRVDWSKTKPIDGLASLPAWPQREHARRHTETRTLMTITSEARRIRPGSASGQPAWWRGCEEPARSQGDAWQPLSPLWHGWVRRIRGYWVIEIGRAH